jgi:hypothetical protein
MPRLFQTPLPFFIFFTSIIWKKSEEEGGKKKEFNIDEILLTDSPAPQDGTAKKVEELEGRVGDLRTMVEGMSSANKSVKNDIEGIKKDISSINDTIKDLLAVYEIVNKEYNPFIDVDARPANMRASKDNPSTLDKADLHVIPYKFKDPGEGVDKTSDIVRRGLTNEMKANHRDDGFTSSIAQDKLLDRVIRPDEESDDQSTYGTGEIMQPTTKMEERRAESPADTNYCLAQMLKLVEFQLEKLYNCKVSGRKLSDEDLDQLYRWLGEYKRFLVN